MRSLFGELRVRRAYYYCSHCKRGDFPWDRTLALGWQRMTAAVEELVTLAGTCSSFAKAGFLLAKIGGLKIPESTVERTTEETGEALAEAQSAGQVFEPEEQWPWPLDEAGQRYGYVGLDGIHVRMQGPHGAAAESRVEYVGRLYIPPEDTEDGLGRTRYVVGQTIEEAIAQLQRQMLRVGGDQVQHWLCLTDGGSGLEQQLTKAFCFSEWHLDFWHAAEYLRVLAKALFDDAPQRTAWGDQWCHDLKHEGGPAVLLRLRNYDVSQSSSAARTAHADVLRYYENQLHGMDYPRYMQRGWQIGSGPTEGACRVVVDDRLKQSGMRWCPPGAQYVSRNRALLLNGPASWNSYWATRKSDRKAVRKTNRIAARKAA